jgi:hypothetical protein
MANGIGASKRFDCNGECLEEKAARKKLRKSLRIFQRAKKQLAIAAAHRFSMHGQTLPGN